MRSLVIFYSKSGNTLTVATTIQKAIGAHVKEIEDNTIHRTVLDYLFPNLIDSARIEPKTLDIDYYQTIFIGTPVWLGSLTPAIKKIIDNIEFKNKNIILFTTMKSVGEELALNRMEKLVKNRGGNIIGAFAIQSTGSQQDLVDCTYNALEDLNLV